MRAEKVHLKNTQVLKKNLFVVLGHFIRYFTTLLERSNGADMSHSFFWSGATEWSGAAFLERSKRSALQNKRSLPKSEQASVAHNLRAHNFPTKHHK